MTTLKPGQVLTGDSVTHPVEGLKPGEELTLERARLLQKGDLVKHKHGNVIAWLSEPWMDAESMLAVLNPYDVAFLGRPDAEGWIAAPEGGWASNPVPGMTIQSRFSDGSGGIDLSDDYGCWSRLIAFRPLSTKPQGEDQGPSAAPIPTEVRDAAVLSFQDRCGAWLDACFGPESRTDVPHRNARFLEEALELVQASGMTKAQALDVVSYVWSRDQGQINQEVGGVMMTLAAHCLATGNDMYREAERELWRVWTKVDVIRAPRIGEKRK